MVDRVLLKFPVDHANMDITSEQCCDMIELLHRDSFRSTFWRLETKIWTVAIGFTSPTSVVRSVRIAGIAKPIFISVTLSSATAHLVVFCGGCTLAKILRYSLGLGLFEGSRWTRREAKSLLMPVEEVCHRRRKTFSLVWISLWSDICWDISLAQCAVVRICVCEHFGQKSRATVAGWTLTAGLKKLRILGSPQRSMVRAYPRSPFHMIKGNGW